MPNFGGLSPYPRRLGGGRSRVQPILEALAVDRGTAYDASNRNTTVYVENMAIARAISAAWGANERLANICDPYRCGMEILGRWEAMFKIVPEPSDTDTERRNRVAAIFARFGQAATEAYITGLLSAALGAVFVAVEHITFVVANITVPDATYPWGIVTESPWSSSIAHVLIRLQRPTGWTEADFYKAAAKVSPILQPILPVWATWNWYRPGSLTNNVSGGPSAAGFKLDEAHNLNEQVFHV